MASLKTYSMSSSDIDIEQLSKQIESSNSVSNFDGLLIHEGVLTVFGTSINNETALDSRVNVHNPIEISTLRVHRVLPKNRNPLISDFTILGFRKESPSYDRGRKFHSLYKCVTSEDIIAEKKFTDIWEDDKLSISCEFNFYTEDDTVGLTKTETVVRYNKYETETAMRGRRERQLDYLKASVKGTDHEAFLDILSEHYTHDIQKYVNDGNLTLNESMINETDPMISAILASDVNRNDGEGLTTVMKSFQYQMGTIGIEDL